jgi:hypothetical protein
MAAEMKQIEMNWEATKNKTKEARALHNKTVEEAQKKWEPYRERIRESAEMLTGNMAKMSDGFKRQSEEMMQFGERAAKTWADATKAHGAQVASELHGVSNEHKAKITAVYDRLAKAQAHELKQFLATTTLTGDALNAKVAEIKTKYEGMAIEVDAGVKASSKNLLAGTSESFDRFSKNFMSKHDELGKKLDVKSKAMAGSIEKEFGVSGDAAVDAVSKIASINPKKFERNMRRVTKSFKKFLDTLDKEVKDLVKNTAKNINKFWEDSKKGWEEQERLVTKFGEDAKRASDKMWSDITSSAAGGIKGLSGVARTISGSIRTIFQNINILDLLASQDDITNWANRIIDGLATAFMKGGSFGIVLDRSFTRALANADAFRQKKKAEAATAGGATGGTTDEGDQQVKTGRSAVMSLRNSVNNPTWARSGQTIPTKLDTIASEIKKLKTVIGVQKFGAEAVDALKD